MDKLDFKCAGCIANDGFRNILQKLSKKYKQLQYGEGKRPKVRIRHVDFKAENFRDKNAVAVDLKISGNWYQAGWLKGRPEEGQEVVDNVLVSKFIKQGDVIERVAVNKLGYFKDNSGKEIAYLHITIYAKLD